MPPRIYPEKPLFKSKAEEKVFNSLIKSLSSDDVIFCNLEFTDSNNGDIEIDFVVMIKDRGCTVVEVKGGHIVFDGKSWIQSDSKSSREIFPASQAKRNMYAFRDFLRNRWSQGNIRTDWVVCFPESDVPDVGSVELPKLKIVDKSDLNFIVSNIKSLLDSQRNIPAPQGSSWLEAAILNLKPVATEKIDRAIALGNNYEFIKELTHQRVSLLEQMSENNKYYIRGPAGSGKTWLAFEQARIWAEEGLRVGVVAFNRGLVSYFEKKSSELTHSNRPAFLGTFHDYAKLIGTTAGTPSKYRNEEDPYANNLIKFAENMNSDERYDAFVIDEAQDFMASWWETLLISLKNREEGRIAAFGDDQQKIFGLRSEPRTNLAKFKLSENVRNSRQIAELAAPLGSEAIIVRGPNSFPIDFIISEEVDAISKADNEIERLTDKEFWQPGEIALLTTKNRHPQHAEQVNKNRSAYWDDFWKNDQIFYGTVGGFKGLERPVVVLAVDGFHNSEDFEDFLYVGLTRARDKLVIIGNQKLKKKLGLK